MLYPDVLGEQSFVRQHGHHWGDPVGAPIDDDQAVDLLRRLEGCIDIWP